MSDNTPNSGIYKLFLVGIPIGTAIMLPGIGAGWVLPKLLVFSGTAFLMGVLLMLRRASIPFPARGFLGWFLFAYVALVICSPLWSVVPLQSILGASPRFLGVLAHVTFFAFGFAAFLLARDARCRGVLQQALILTHTIVVLYGFLQLFSLDPFESAWEPGTFFGRPFSMIGQPNALGSFLLLTIPIVALAALESRRWSRWWKGIAVIAGLVLLLSTASRAALIGLVVLLPIVIIARWEMWKKYMTPWRFAACGAVILLLAAVSGYELRDRFSHPTESGRSASARILVWSAVPAIVRERPFGFGLESMGVVFPRFAPPGLVAYEKLTAGVDRAHSFPLDLLVTLGFPGVISFIGFLLLLLFAAWRHCHENAFLAGILAIVGYSVSLLFGFETVVTGVLFWVMVGMLLGLLAERENRMDARSLGRSSFFLMLPLTVALVAASIVSAQWMHAKITARDAEALFRRGELLESVQEFARARQKFRFDREILAALTETALLTIEKEEDAKTHAALRAIAESAVDDLASLTHDHDAMTWLLRAWLSAITGEKARAEEELSQARLLQPSSVTTYRIAAHVYELLGMEEERERAFHDLIRLLPPLWRDKSTEAGRILWKENPWLQELTIMVP